MKDKYYTPEIEEFHLGLNMRFLFMEKIGT